jgi:regulatory protein
MSRERTIESKLRNYVFLLLKYRSRSEKEIREKLTTKKNPPEIIDKVIADLKKIGLIDDRKFALDWLNFRLKAAFGIKKVIFELKQKGIDKDIINELIKRAEKENLSSGILQSLAEKKFRMLGKRHMDKFKIKQKLFNYLMRRGFSPADTLGCLDKLVRR